MPTRSCPATSTAVSVLIALVLAIPPARGQADIGRPGVGAGARIFFTQCLSSIPAPEEFRKLADAGFTIVVNPTDIMEPTRNRSSLEAMPAYFRRAADVGLDAGIFQGGYAPAEGAAITRVTRDGRTGPYLPAHSAAGWEAIGDTLVAWARLSVVHRNFKFAGMDFEMYKGGGPDFGESYDTETLAAFFQSIGSSAPEPTPAPGKRYEQLRESGLAEQYIEFQRQALLREVKKVRARINAVNPRFQVGVYGSGAFIPTVIEGLATQAAPALDLDARTYARGMWDPAYDHEPGGGYAPTARIPDRAGLKWSRILVSTGCRAARQRPYPVVYLGGHWPQVAGPPDGSQYRFTVRQSFDSAAYGDGYWIWTEPFVPRPWTDKQEWVAAMLAYWQEANAALDAGDYTWSERQKNAVEDPAATKPALIATTAGETISLWNPVTGQRVSSEHRSGAVAAATTQASFKGNTIRIDGSTAELVDQKTGEVLKEYAAGHGLRAVAVGEVDGIAGDEVVTLNAGWVRVFDPESASELLRFRVGNDQTALVLRRQ